MDARDIVLEGVELHAYFQPYHLNLSNGGRPPHTSHTAGNSGELLTRPGGNPSHVEAYFSNLTVDQHFTVLEWHLGLAKELSVKTNTHVSINLHNSVINDEENRERLLYILRAFHTPLTFEFTETYPMPAVAIANRLLREIRKLGHSTALDDFGTGLNGMSLLTDFDFDIIKIDRSLTFDLAERLKKKKMLGLILKMLEVLGRDHVVEGIDDADVYEFLVGLGFTQFQGFLFEKPLPVGEFLATHSTPREENNP